jgi:predicted O-methyltransferase YrrM
VLLAALTSADLEALLWTSRRPTHGSAWHGHVAFAHWLVTAIRPELIVELGTQNGVSYAAFCHAVSAGGLPCRCFAVDTWQGDTQTGTYDDEIYNDLKQFNDAYYGRFSTLLRCTFDEALPGFQDGTIDLLHIDGLHTYEAVRHDFETWLPKLSQRAVVLFHDIAVREPHFGVWRLWQELRARYPSFSFEHSAGLGVLAVGPSTPAMVHQLCCVLDSWGASKLRERLIWFSAEAQAAASSTREILRLRAVIESLRAAAASNPPGDPEKNG